MKSAASVVTRKLGDGVERTTLVMFLSDNQDSAVLSLLNGKGHMALEVLCQGLEVQTTSGNWQARPVCMT